MTPISLDIQIEAVRAEAEFAASYAATAAIDRLSGRAARQRAEALAAAVVTLKSIAALQDFVAGPEADLAPPPPAAPVPLPRFAGEDQESQPRPEEYPYRVLGSANLGEVRT